MNLRKENITQLGNMEQETCAICLYNGHLQKFLEYDL